MKNEHQNLRWIRLGVILILMVLIIDLVFTMRLSSEVKSMISEIQTKKSLPCAAIPTKYILQEPACADKLLRVMNVTNVQIMNNMEPASATRREAEPLDRSSFVQQTT